MQESVLLVSLLTPVKIPQKKKEMPFWTTSLSNFSGHFDWWPIHSYISISGITLYPRLSSGLIQKCFGFFFLVEGIFSTPVLSSESYHCLNRLLHFHVMNCGVEDVSFWTCVFGHPLLSQGEESVAAEQPVPADAQQPRVETSWTSRAPSISLERSRILEGI